MKNSKPPLSIRVIYWLTQAVFGLTLLSGFAVILFNILVYTPFFGNNLQLHVQMPVTFDVLERGNLYLSQRTIEVELVEASSKIHFFNTPLFLARIFGSAVLLAFGFIFYLVFEFRKFIANVNNDKIFASSNIELLRNIAYGLLGLWFYGIIYSRVIYHFIGKYVVFEHVSVTGDHRNFAGLLMLALFMWVLSHVFLVGSRLREEQDLTI